MIIGSGSSLIYLSAHIPSIPTTCLPHWSYTQQVILIDSWERSWKSSIYSRTKKKENPCSLSNSSYDLESPRRSIKGRPASGDKIPFRSRICIEIHPTTVLRKIFKHRSSIKIQSGPDRTGWSVPSSIMYILCTTTYILDSNQLNSGEIEYRIK